MPTGTPMDSMIIVQSGIIKWLTMSYPISCVCGVFFVLDQEIIYVLLSEAKKNILTKKEDNSMKQERVTLVTILT